MPILDLGKVVGADGKDVSLLSVYPVGSIYLSVNSTSPASLFGGTWEQVKDRFLLGAGSSYANGTTGGEATHALTVNEMPEHRHSLTTHYVAGETKSYVSKAELLPDSAVGGVTGYSGGNRPHNNMPPYLVVYMWKRVS